MMNVMNKIDDTNNIAKECVILNPNDLDNIIQEEYHEFDPNQVVPELIIPDNPKAICQ